jgi:hypothetical protein
VSIINEFLKNRCFRVAIGSTLSEEKQIENGVVQGAVLSVTLLLVVMVDITHIIEEPININGYADNTHHSQTRTSKPCQTTKSHGKNRQMGRQYRLSNLN